MMLGNSALGDPTPQVPAVVPEVELSVLTAVVALPEGNVRREA